MIRKLREYLAKKRKDREKQEFEDGVGFALTQILHYGRPIEEVESLWDPEPNEMYPFDKGFIIGVRTGELILTSLENADRILASSKGSVLVTPPLKDPSNGRTKRPGTKKTQRKEDG